MLYTLGKNFRIQNIILPLSLALTACGVESEPAQLPSAVEEEITRLETELAELPGELIMTTSSQMPFSDELRAKLAAADKVLHVYADGRVIAYLGSPAQIPEGVPSFRTFRELHGDIVIANQELLPDYLRQEESSRPDGDVSEAVSLPIGHGAQWPDSTVAYEIDGSISNPSELDMVRQSITTWNASTDPYGNTIKVRFAPRYWADNRPYIRFVRGGSGGCGSSYVGRHDNIFTNWWSHDIKLDCFSQSTIHHEMAHTVGLYHEQQRCDRNNYVYVGSPGGVNCERYCSSSSSSDYGPYNYLSVMHYYYSNSPAACSIQQITPSAFYYRGAPWQAGTAPGLDSYDVQAINQSYVGRPSLPAVGPSTYYSLVPQFTSKVFIVPGSSTDNNVPIILYDRYAGYWDQHWSVLDAGAGYVELRPRHAPWKCMEVYGFSTSNGGSIKQWDCWGGDNQKWIIAPNAGAPGTFDIINKLSGKSLDVSGWSNANGTLIQQWDHNNGTNQRIVLSPAF